MKLLILLLLTTTQYLFALISIVPIGIGEEPGTTGSFEAGLETKRGNTHKDNYKTAVRVNYDNNSTYVLWGEISGEYGKANHVEDTNKIYSHMRFIHTLNSKLLNGEIFLQSQEDKFKALAKRRLAGGGLRLELFETLKGGKGYFGFGGFYEYIKHTDPSADPDEGNIRLNSYLSYAVKLAEDSTLAYTMYYQPRIDQFSDYVIANKFELQLHIYLELFLKFSVYYDVDSAHPSSINEDYDFGQTTTFVINF